MNENHSVGPVGGHSVRNWCAVHSDYADACGAEGTGGSHYVRHDPITFSDDPAMQRGLDGSPDGARWLAEHTQDHRATWDRANAYDNRMRDLIAPPVKSKSEPGVGRPTAEESS